MLFPKFLAQAERLRIYGLQDQQKWEEYQKTLHGTVEIIVKHPQSLRTLQQNRYYWGVIVELISQHTGYAKEETHEILKAKFLSREVIVKEERIRYARSTTTLTTKQFNEYIEEIKEWAFNTFNLIIPEPEDVYDSGI